jgi:type IX secretion system PorP/SprF family membrane protein
MSKPLTLLFLLAFGSSVKAQQVPFYNHNMLNPFVFNPSMAGASGDVNAFLVRNQRYTAFSNTSVNNHLSVDGAFMQGKGGFGIHVAHQAYGIQQQLSSSLAYAYRIRFNDYSDLRFGVSGGLIDNRIDLSAINAMDQDDPYLATMRQKVSGFDMSAGLSYLWKSLRVGFAIPQLIGNKVAFDKENSRGYYRLARHYMFSGEYDFHFSGNKDLVFRPNAIVRFVPGAPLQYDLTAFIDHSKIGWASVGYKSGYSIQTNLGFRVGKQFKVGYSYEYLIGDMKRYSTGAHHEILLGFTFRSKEKPEIREIVVEKEVVVTDTVQIAQYEKEKEELAKKNQELEELLRKTLAEKEQVEKEKQLVEQEKKVLEQKQSTAQNSDRTGTGGTPGSGKTTGTPGKTNPGLAEIKIAKGYKFIELDSLRSNSPDGFYVVCGVFSSTQNANASLARNRKYFPDAYLVINQRNGYYYVILKYTKDQAEAVAVESKYIRVVKKDAWILNYIAPLQ